ncbi:MAG: DUF1127 domain-containing protein [Rhodospirillales bacterium]|nr:DUF1127 domain-containing protein [Rhodospirillales bacterium]MDE0377692.1 DUF1127 domain-containing protein [Rhodospirillales bacterium]
MDFASITQAVRNWQERHRARRELESLTDRELADIGISRGCIDAAVRGTIVRSRTSGIYAGR